MSQRKVFMLKLNGGVNGKIVNFYYESNDDNTERWACVNELERVDGKIRIVRVIERISLKNLGERAGAIVADMIEDAIRICHPSEIMGLGSIEDGFQTVTRFERNIYNLLNEKGVFPPRSSEGDRTRT